LPAYERIAQFPAPNCLPRRLSGGETEPPRMPRKWLLARDRSSHDLVRDLHHQRG